MCMMSIDAFPGIILPLPESIRNLSRNRGGEDGRKLKKTVRRNLFRRTAGVLIPDPPHTQGGDDLSFRGEPRDRLEWENSQ